MKNNKDCVDDQKIDIRNLQAQLIGIIKQKEYIIKAVEQEEDNVKNKLQKKLNLVLRDKINIEKRLEAEQEYIVNKLQKQLNELDIEKDNLEKQIKDVKSYRINLVSNLEEEHRAINDIKNSLNHVNKEKHHLEMKLADEIQQNEEIISMIENERNEFTATFQRKLKSLRSDKKRLRMKINAEGMSLIDTLYARIHNLLNESTKDFTEGLLISKDSIQSTSLSKNN